MKIFEHKFFSLQEKRGLFSSTEFSFADEAERAAVVEFADRALSFEIPALPAMLYMEFARNGNRNRYEAPYFARRDALRDLLLGTLACGGDKYTERMIDLIWSICEETSWVIPAHNVSHPYRLTGEALPDAFADDIVEIDLFSAETAALLAWVYHYAKEKLDAVSPVVCRRIEYEIDRRILKPFRRLEMRWMTNFINNWTPWIVSNVLTCVAVFEKEWRERQMLVSISIDYLNRFAETYGEDGGCNEGASYWRAAVATLFDAASILYDITGGTLDAFDSPLLFRMCEYFPDVCISPAERLFFNFADCPRHVNEERKMLFRMGEKLGSEKLLCFASEYNPAAVYGPSRRLYHVLAGLCEAMPEEKRAPVPQNRTAVYPDLQLAVWRRGAFSLAVKGGHNRESHNHNDIGSFILYNGTTPVIIDAGVGVYSRDTFSEKRYTIWTMQSSFHNLPEIDGQMQLPGRQYRAEAFEADEKGVFISYKNAYPHDMKASSVTRRIDIGENKITVCDNVEGASSVFFHLMTAEKPLAIDGGVTVGGCKILFCGDYTIESVDISYDASLKRDWARETLYRVRIASSGKLDVTIAAIG